MSTRVIVDNVSPRLTREELERFFSEIGEVVSLDLPVNPDTGETRGTALVEFEDEEQAEWAIESLDGTVLDDRRLRLRWSLEDPQAAGSARHRGAKERLREAGSRFDDSASRDPRGRRPERLRDDGSEGLQGKAEKGTGRGAGHGSDRKRGRGKRRVVE